MWCGLDVVICSEFKIIINYLVSKHMLVCCAAGLIHRVEGSELAKSLLKSVDNLIAFDL